MTTGPETAPDALLSAGEWADIERGITSTWGHLGEPATIPPGWDQARLKWALGKLVRSLAAYRAQEVQLADLRAGADHDCSTIEYLKADVDYLRAQVERQAAERLKLDKRIHNQRVALRADWQIWEMRNEPGKFRQAAFRWCLRMREVVKENIQLRAALTEPRKDDGAGE